MNQFTRRVLAITIIDFGISVQCGCVFVRFVQLLRSMHTTLENVISAIVRENLIKMTGIFRNLNRSPHTYFNVATAIVYTA